MKRFERFLRQADVSLALDSEWSMQPGQVPGDTIGGRCRNCQRRVCVLVRIDPPLSVAAETVMVHQFTPDMIAQRNAVSMRPNLAIVFHVDGFGGRAVKISKYRLLSADRRGAFIGFKLFYAQDVGMFSAAEVMRFSPRPDLVTYQ